MAFAVRELTARGFVRLSQTNLADLQAQLETRTGVPQGEQKLLGLAKAGAGSMAGLAGLKTPLVLVGTPRAAMDAFRADDAAAAAARAAAAASAAERQAIEDARNAAAMARAQAELARADAVARDAAQTSARELAAARDAAREREASAVVTHGGTLAATLTVRVDEQRLGLGNQALFPQAVLAAAMDAGLALPLCFRLVPVSDAGQAAAATHADDDSWPCCSVLEFTAPPGCLIVGVALAARLGIAASDAATRAASAASAEPDARAERVAARSVVLPRAKFVQLTALDSGLARVSAAARGALLEATLRGRYSALVLGDTVRCQTAGQSFALAVTALRPARAVSLVDTDVELEFVAGPWADGASGEAASSDAHGVDGPASAPRAHAHAPLTLSVGADPTEIPLDADGWAFACVSAAVRGEPGVGLTVALDFAAGDPCVYVGAGWRGPHARPTALRFDWRDVTSGGSRREVHVAPEHLGSHDDDVDAVLTVGVHAWGASALVGARLSVRLEATPVARSPEADPGFVSCDECGRSMPLSSLALHAARCVRIARRACAHCRLRLTLDAAAKHEALEHTAVVCDCGTELAGPGELPHHQRELCPLRPVRCRYCVLPLVAADRGAHQAVCGAITSLCAVCGQRVARKSLVRHMESHGVFLDDTAGVAVLEDAQRSPVGSPNRERSTWGAERARPDPALAAEPLVACPLCGLEFGLERIARHASLCAEGRDEAEHGRDEGRDEAEHGRDEAEHGRDEA